MGGGRSASTRMRPLASTSEAMRVRKDRCPDWRAARPSCPSGAPPARRSTVRSKLNAPRDPRNSVGSVGAKARAVGGDQHVGAKRLAAPARRCRAAPASPVSSPVSSRTLTLKPRRPRASSTRGECREVDRVLALVVGRAAAVPAIAFAVRASRATGRRATARRSPGRRRRGRRSAQWAASGSLDALRDEERPSAGGVVDDPDGEPEARERRADLVGEIGEQASRRHRRAGSRCDTRRGVRARRRNRRDRTTRARRRWRLRGRVEQDPALPRCYMSARRPPYDPTM